MNDVIFLLRSSSDQLLYNVEQLLSTKKKNSACSTELNAFRFGAENEF